MEKSSPNLNTPIETVRPTDHTRREFLKGLFAGSLMATVGCSQEPQKKISNVEPQPINRNPIDVQQLNNSWPKVRLTEVDKERYQPSQFVPDIETELLRKISHEFSQFVKKYFTEEIAPLLKGSDLESTKLASDKFINGIIGPLINRHPKIKENFIKHNPTFKSSIHALLIAINNFLIRDGLYIDLHVDSTSDFGCINLYEIESLHLVQFTDQSTQTLMLKLNDQYVSRDDLAKPYRNMRATYDPKQGFIIWDEESLINFMKNNGSLRDVRKYLPDAPNVEEAMKGEGSYPIIAHEAYHHLFFLKSTSDISRASNSERDSIDTEIKLRDGRVYKISKQVHPYAFHEFASIGAGLMATDSKSIHCTRLFLPSHMYDEVPPTYQLARDFLVFSFSNKGVPPLQAALMADPEELQELGKDMLNIANHLLQAREAK